VTCTRPAKVAHRPRPADALSLLSSLRQPAVCFYWRELEHERAARGGVLNGAGGCLEEAGLAAQVCQFARCSAHAWALAARKRTVAGAGRQCCGRRFLAGVGQFGSLATSRASFLPLPLARALPCLHCRFQSWPRRRCLLLAPVASLPVASLPCCLTALPRTCSFALCLVWCVSVREDGGALTRDDGD
jgi:hypothetical protein